MHFNLIIKILSNFFYPNKLSFFLACLNWVTLRIWSVNNYFYPFSVEKQEIEKLITMFANITGGLNNKLDRTKFRDILHISFNMTDDILMDRGWLFAKLFNLTCCWFSYSKWCSKGFVFVWDSLNTKVNVFCIQCNFSSKITER